MIHSYFRYLIPALACLVLFADRACGQNNGLQVPVNPLEVQPNLGQALSGVRWHGKVPTSDVIGDKTPVVMVYATWCPICNEWSPTMFSQLREAANKSPSVIFAINADETAPGPKYAQQLNLSGANIFHGSDPSIVARMGLATELFQTVVYDDQGEPQSVFSAGSRYTNSGNYVLPDNLNKNRYQGKFSVLDGEMSDEMRNLFWPVELGVGFDERSLIRARKRLPDELQSEFNSIVSRILDDRLAKIQELLKSEEAKDSVLGYELAEQLSDDFGSTPHGRTSKSLIEPLEENDVFQSEVAAKNSYVAVAAKASRLSDSALKAAMNRVAKRFPETHYGKLADRVRETGILAKP